MKQLVLYAHRIRNDMTSDNGVFWGFWASVLLCLFVGGGAGTAYGQLMEHDRGSQQEHRYEEDRPFDTGARSVPTWAEPSAPEKRERSIGRMETKGPVLPSEGGRVPIGGLGWLIAMGMGYGVWRLRDGGASRPI